MLRKLHVVGELSVKDEKELHSICSSECHNIVLAMSNYDRSAQEQFMGVAVMSLMRLGATSDNIRTTFEMVLGKAEEICAKSPFPCQRAESTTPVVSERNFYEYTVAR